MPSRKQRQRKQKAKRHEYETVWLDDEGNVLDEPPPEALAPKQRTNGASAASATKSTKGQPSRGRGRKERHGGPPARGPAPGAAAAVVGARGQAQPAARRLLHGDHLLRREG